GDAGLYPARAAARRRRRIGCEASCPAPSAAKSRTWLRQLWQGCSTEHIPEAQETSAGFGLARFCLPKLSEIMRRGGSAPPFVLDLGAICPQSGGGYSPLGVPLCPFLRPISWPKRTGMNHLESAPLQLTKIVTTRSGTASPVR